MKKSELAKIVPGSHIIISCKIWDMEAMEDNNLYVIHTRDGLLAYQPDDILGYADANKAPLAKGERYQHDDVVLVEAEVSELPQIDEDDELEDISFMAKFHDYSENGEVFLSSSREVYGDEVVQVIKNTIGDIDLSCLKRDVAKINAEIIKETGKDDDCISIPNTDDGDGWVTIDILDFDGKHDYSVLHPLLAKHGVVIDESEMGSFAREIYDGETRIKPSIESGDGTFAGRDCRLFGYTLRVIK